MTAQLSALSVTAPIATLSAMPRPKFELLSPEDIPSAVPKAAPMATPKPNPMIGTY